ncbi:MAG: acyl-CoA dehydrogenase family protein [Candidatus Nanopelagicales bacterium]
MDFEPSTKAQDYLQRLSAFMDSEVYPAEAVYEQQMTEQAASGQAHQSPPVVEHLKARAREAGLWNLFLPDESGLSVTDYAPLAELTGRSPHLAPEALNCSAPDTGNMEVLHMFGTEQQKAQWLEPLLEGRIRSGFAMTEPAVASSDATNIETSIATDGEDYVINGRKWWTTGAMDPRCEILILMGKTDPAAEVHRQQSMVLVPMKTPGVRIERNLTVFGYTEQPGHAEISFTDVRVPRSNLLAQEGMGFAIAQARLGPGRVHHCMRAIGMAERALDMMCDRALERVAFHRPLAAQGVVREWIARSRLAIDQARLLVLHTAWVIDQRGAKAARQQIAGIKAVVPQMALDVVDRAIQTYGGAGVSQVTPLAEMWAGLRTLRLADGPDEVHLRDVARLELKAHLDG